MTSFLLKMSWNSLAISVRFSAASCLNWNFWEDVVRYLLWIDTRSEGVYCMVLSGMTLDTYYTCVSTSIIDAFAIRCDCRYYSMWSEKLRTFKNIGNNIICTCFSLYTASSIGDAVMDDRIGTWYFSLIICRSKKR